MTKNDYNLDISNPKNRKRIINIIENKLNNYYEIDEENFTNYNKIGEYLSKIDCCLNILSNSYDIDTLLEIKIRAIQFGIEDLIDRDDINTIDDLVLYGHEINWTTNNPKYKYITKILDSICIYLNEADEFIDNSDFCSQIESLEYFRDDLVEMLNNLMNTRYILNNEEVNYLNGLSKEKQIDFIDVYLHEIGKIDIKIASIVKELVGVKLFIKKYI